MTTDTITQTVVTLTPNAAREILALRSQNPAHADKPLRVYVEGGCCSNLSFGMCFDQAQPGDHVSRQHEVDVVTDPESLQHLEGAVLDHAAGEGFLLTNPAASKGSCGCGSGGGEGGCGSHHH